MLKVRKFAITFQLFLHLLPTANLKKWNNGMMPAPVKQQLRYSCYAGFYGVDPIEMLRTSYFYRGILCLPQAFASLSDSF